MMDAGSLNEAQLQSPQSDRRERGRANGASLKSGWSAQLCLEYACANGRTQLSRNLHKGPLAVQKSLYPEGPAVCNTLILHPPGGIVGGDTLDIAVRLATGSQTLITTPGAAKWYRSAGAPALQCLDLALEAGATLEWLPQETILFNGAIAGLHASVDLAAGAHYLGWDILCLGRTAAGEKFDAGEIRQTTDIMLAGDLIWSERCRMKGGSPLLESSAGLAGAPVSGIMIAAGKNVPAVLLAQCRAVTVDAPARAGISAMPGILVARYTGHSCEQAKAYFIALWRKLRPFVAGRAAVLPRIWNT